MTENQKIKELEESIEKLEQVVRYAARLLRMTPECLVETFALLGSDK